MNQRFAVFVMSLCFAVPSFGQAVTVPKPLSPLEQSLLDAEKSFVAAAKKGDVAFFTGRTCWTSSAMAASTCSLTI